MIKKDLNPTALGKISLRSTGLMVTARPDDVNNFHFGVVGKASLWFTERFMLRVAGAAEMDKWATAYKMGKRPTPEVPASWRPVIGVQYDMGARERAGKSSPELDWPYGDNPEDSRWIMTGFEYYKTGGKK